MDEHAIRAVGALYQGEKADATGIFNVAMAMMGIAAAYLVGAVGYINNLGATNLGPLAFLLPAPLWLILAYNSLLTLNSMMHGSSVRILEDQLFSLAAFDPALRGFIGSKGGDRIMDARESHPSHKWATRLAFGGLGVGILAFTIYILWSAWNSVHVIIALAIAGVYAIAMAVILWSWKNGDRITHEAYEVAKNFLPMPGPGAAQP